MGPLTDGTFASMHLVGVSHVSVPPYTILIPQLTSLESSYLPPPVLVVLNSKQFEAAKQAALITTALKWLLDHLPLDVLPLQLRPAAALLRSLVPVIGYIGSFIGWSWSAVCSFDRGQGVVLSATWLLPIALIPGTWEENELPSGAQVISVNPAHPVSSVAGPSR